MFERFTEHPTNVCLSYIQHMKFAMEMSGRLLVGSGQAFIHAWFPFLFISSTSELNTVLTKRLSEVGCRSEGSETDSEANNEHSEREVE